MPFNSFVLYFNGTYARSTFTIYSVGEENMMVFALTQLFLTLPVMYINRGYFQRGFKSLWHRSPNMDTLIAIGSTAAAVYSIYAIFMMG